MYLILCLIQGFCLISVSVFPAVKALGNLNIVFYMNTFIEIENLKKNFGDLTAVDGLNFRINGNEIFGLLGPNGAGKTTTINMICGLLPATEGRITFPGHQGKDHKSLIGYCPQENVFYPKLTCLEQL